MSSLPENFEKQLKGNAVSADDDDFSRCAETLSLSDTATAAENKSLQAYNAGVSYAPVSALHIMPAMQSNDNQGLLPLTYAARKLFTQFVCDHRNSLGFDDVKLSISPEIWKFIKTHFGLSYSDGPQYEHCLQNLETMFANMQRSAGRSFKRNVQLHVTQHAGTAKRGNGRGRHNRRIALAPYSTDRAEVAGALALPAEDKELENVKPLVTGTMSEIVTLMKGFQL